jgi:hypothetical protein
MEFCQALKRMGQASFSRVSSATRKALVLECSGSNIAASKINPEPAQVRS